MTVKLDYKKYLCSIHGKTGDFKCQECWDNLQRMLHDANAGVVLPTGEFKKP